VKRQSPVDSCAANSNCVIITYFHVVIKIVVTKKWHLLYCVVVKWFVDEEHTA